MKGGMRSGPPVCQAGLQTGEVLYWRDLATYRGVAPDSDSVPSHSTTYSTGEMNRPR